MNENSLQNKIAWEYNAYDFWVREAGRPRERAQDILADPLRHLRKYAPYFDTFQGVRVANICGSCGKKAVPLAVLGAEVTVFDISAHNARYATELAQAAQVSLRYEVGDVLEIDLEKYGESFDVVFMEDGILHYFHDLDQFMGMMHALLKPGGRLICSDFHPLTKVMDVLGFQRPAMSYFSTDILEAEMPHAKFYEEEQRQQFPKCRLRLYTLSEIINAVIAAGFTLKQFDEHPAWTNGDLPGEFTILAGK
ncbi:MAG: class I SAM-dependent methyltransferase [Clostridia bacterium]|nr:class I SAM-dependent methyltransferase [Clostridia bacterium]